LFRDYHYALSKQLGQQTGFKQIKFRIKSKIFLLDASTISLCLSLFDWAKYKTKKEAYDIPLIKGSVIVAGRFYNDFSLLNVWDSTGVFFVIRYKINIKFETIKERELSENRHPQLLKDEIIELIGTASKKKYPKRLRRVAIWDEKNAQIIEVITNHMAWCTNRISDLYKSCWAIEIFFRDIKQLLHIKSFIGTSQNAVMIQIWTALITILILKYFKKTAKYNWYLFNLVAFLKINLFVKIELQKWLDKPFLKKEKPPNIAVQGGSF